MCCSEWGKKVNLVLLQSVTLCLHCDYYTQSFALFYAKVYLGWSVSPSAICVRWAPHSPSPVTPQMHRLPLQTSCMQGTLRTTIVHNGIWYSGSPSRKSPLFKGLPCAKLLTFGSRWWKHMALSFSTKTTPLQRPLFTGTKGLEGVVPYYEVQCLGGLYACVVCVCISTQVK